MSENGNRSSREHMALPDGWTLAELQSVAEINPKAAKHAYSDSLEVSFVPMPAIEAGSGAIDVAATRRLSDVKKGYTPFQEGDVLFAKITPCMENGKMAVVPPLKNDLGFGSTEFHVLRPYDGVCARYLYHFVSSRRFRRDAEHHMTGAVGQRRVPTSYIAAHRIPVAPPAEQVRIASKIDEVFSGIDKGLECLRTAREQLKLYRQVVLRHAFEGRLSRSRQAQGRPRMPAALLGDVASLVTSGSRGWAKYYSAEGDIFIRAQNLKYDRLDLSDVAFVNLPSDASEGTRTLVQSGDVLVTITGANVTKTALVEREIGTAYVSQHVALVRPTEVVVPEFLYWFLIAEAGGRKQLNEAAYGAGKPGLNLENIRSVVVPLPDRAEQEEIVAHIETLLASATNVDGQVEVGIQQADVLREAVLCTAFAGRLSARVLTGDAAAPLPQQLTKGGVAGTNSRRSKVAG